LPDPSPWVLDEFVPRLDSWIAQDNPDQTLRVQAYQWIFTRYDDPYQGAERAEGFDNLWFVQVPGTQRGDRILTCSFWIHERERRVECDSFAVLSLPFA
jgi:hypothetical protein